MKLTSNLGILLLGIWLVLTGLISLIGLHFSGLGVIMSVLALVAGILMIVGR